MDGDVVERGITLTPPVSKGGSEQNSRGSSICNDPLSPSNSDEKVQSRYLRPSMASCHDFCKYGIKHAYEDGNRPTFRAFLREKLAQDRDRVQALSPGLHERQKKSVTKQESTKESKHTRKSIASGENEKSISSGKNKKSSSSGNNKAPRISPGNERNQVESLRLSAQKKGKGSSLQSEFSPDQPNVIGAKSPPREPSFIEPKSPHNEPNIIEPKSFAAVPSVIEPKSPNEIDIFPVSEIDASGDPNIKKENEKSSVTNSPTSVSAKAVKQKGPPSVKKPMAPSVKKVMTSTKPQYRNQKAPLPLKRADVISKPAIVLKAKTPLVRSLSQHKSSGSLIGRRNQESKPFRSLGTSNFGEKKVWKPRKSSETPPDGVSSLKTRTPLIRSISQLKSSWSLAGRRNQENKILKSLGTTIAGEKKVLKPTIASKTPSGDGVSSLKTTIPMIKSVSQLKSSRSLVGRRNQENKMPRSLGTGTSKVGEKKVLKPTLSSKAPCFGVSSLNQIKLRNVKRSFSVKNKEKEPNQRTDKSKSSTSEVNKEVMEGRKKAEVSKGKVKRGPRSTSTTHSEDSKPTPYKLKFRRGKVIDLRSESMGVRRLWFGIGRLAGDNSKGNGAARKSFRRKRDVSSHDSNDPHSEVHSEVQSVVLKHQDVKEKKDAHQALYNHVIEETASKLVESRKSKVKALVGAFETVISLQESKPASAV